MLLADENFYGVWGPLWPLAATPVGHCRVMLFGLVGKAQLAHLAALRSQRCRYSCV
jgi:hypothetical protein